MEWHVGKDGRLHKEVIEKSKRKAMETGSFS